MKKRLLIPLTVVVLVLLSCRGVPSGLLARPSVTPEPFSLPTQTQTLAPTGTPVPIATPAPTGTPESTPTSVASPAAAAFLPVSFIDQSSVQNDQDRQYTIKLRYPVLEANAPHAGDYNTVVQREVDATVEQFKLDAAEFSKFPADSSGSFLELNYQLFYNQDGLGSLQLHVMIYLKGAAHPNTFTIPVNYDFRAGRELALADLFLPDCYYLDILSAFCGANLLSRDLSLFSEGIAPEMENYRSWNITPEGLRITFDPYQVAPYAAGPQVVHLDWTMLSVLLTPDLGLPAQ